jgi:hypothetical protein
MTYYPTLQEDLDRAKLLLEKGAPEPMQGIPGVPLHLTGGTIYAGDTFAAYKLLESFVQEIERMLQERKLIAAAIQGLIEKVEEVVKEASTPIRGFDK